MKEIRARFCLNLLALIVFAGAFAQTTGTIKGIVTDGRDSTNKPIIGAQVFISGTTFGTFTGIDGSYTLANVPEGKYDISISYVLIGNQKIEGVKVTSGETTIADKAMGKDESVEPQAVVTLVLTKNKESEASAMNEMSESAEVIEVESGSAMQDKGANKASDAAKNISGVSVIEGKYAIVRGLSDRYSKTLLNGADIPGLDPDRVAVQLDLFPSAFIQSMGVVKTYSPDKPGDFTGGLIDIRTKESFDSLTIKANFGISYNPQVHFNQSYIGYDGSSTDFLGFDNGKRDFSKEILTVWDSGEEVEFKQLSDYEYVYGEGADRYYSNPLGAETFYDEGEYEAKIAEVQEIQTSMTDKNQMEPQEFAVPFNHNFGFSMGNSIKVARKDSLKPVRKIGYFAGFNYRRSYSYYNDGISNRYELETTVNTEDSLQRKRGFTTESSSDEVLMGGLASVFFRFNPSNKIKFDYIHNHTGTSSTQRAYGSNPGNADGTQWIRVLNYLQRSMNTFQLSGEHLTDTSFINKTEWLMSYTASSQEQPDFRFFTDDQTVNALGQDQYQTKKNLGEPSRLDRFMNQNNFNAKFDLYKDIIKQKNDTTTLEFNFKAGGNFLFKNRTFNERGIRYLGINTYASGDADEYVGPDLFEVEYNTIEVYNNNGTPTDSSDDFTYYKRDASSDLAISNVYTTSNQYSASQITGAGYLMGTFPLSPKLKLMTGGRVEFNQMTVESEDESKEVGELVNLDFLPVANFTYQFFQDRIKYDPKDSTKIKKQDMKMQFIYSRTLARPTFREIAPFEAPNFVAGYNTRGNPEIERTSIHNFDLRFEFYPNSGELLSASVFYKQFQDPIMRTTTELIGADVVYTWVNLDNAFLYGIELEAKKNLEFISPKLSNWNLGINGTLLTSQAEIPDFEYTRIIQQDPTASKTRPLNGQSPYLLNSYLQYKSDSTGWGLIFTYNQFGERLAFVSDRGLPSIYERGRGEFNIGVSKKVGKQQMGKISFRARNLLNPKYEMYYKFTSADWVEERLMKEGQKGDYIFSSYKKGRRFSISYSYTF